MIAFLPFVFVPDQPSAAFAALPQLTSPTPCKILSENVALTLVSNDRIRITTTTVYRNVGAPGAATIRLTDGLLGAPGNSAHLVATWDNAPLTFNVARTTASAPVHLGQDSTHALRATMMATLSRSGYAKDEYSFTYVLPAGQTIQLFSLAFRYLPGTIFGLPKLTPDLGWEIGNKGAAIRKTDFTAGDIASGDQQVKIEFYRNAMEDLGTKG